MVKIILPALLLAAVASCHAVPSYAKPRQATERAIPYAYDHQATYVAPLPVERTGTPSPPRRAPVRVTPRVASAPEGQPADCRGIQWCGCWLRHQFGLADTTLNLAIAWAKMGSAAEPSQANVVVWRHHVGKLLAVDGDKLYIQSGNDGNAVRTRWVSKSILGGVVAYRKV